jgi:hypothetical protein
MRQAEANEWFTSRCIVLSFPISMFSQELSMKLKTMKTILLAAFAAISLVFGVSAKAATVDLKMPPAAASSAQTGLLQIDAKKALGYTTDGRYTAQVPANSQLSTKKPDMGKKGQFMTGVTFAEADDAKKPAAQQSTMIARGSSPAFTAFAAFNGTDRPMILSKVGLTNSSALQQPNGSMLADAASGGRAGLTIANIA